MRIIYGGAQAEFPLCFTGADSRTSNILLSRWAWSQLNLHTNPEGALLQSCTWGVGWGGCSPSNLFPQICQWHCQSSVSGSEWVCNSCRSFLCGGQIDKLFHLFHSSILLSFLPAHSLCWSFSLSSPSVSRRQSVCSSDAAASWWVWLL